MSRVGIALRMSSPGLCSQHCTTCCTTDVYASSDCTLPTAQARHVSPPTHTHTARAHAHAWKPLSSLFMVLITWACGNLGFHNKNLMEALTTETIRLLKTQGFSAQGLANIAWGYSKLNNRHNELFKVLGLEAFRPFGLWACEVLE